MFGTVQFVSAFEEEQPERFDPMSIHPQYSSSAVQGFNDHTHKRKTTVTYHSHDIIESDPVSPFLTQFFTGVRLGQTISDYSKTWDRGPKMAVLNSHVAECNWGCIPDHVALTHYSRPFLTA